MSTKKDDFIKVRRSDLLTVYNGLGKILSLYEDEEDLAIPTITPDNQAKERSAVIRKVLTDLGVRQGILGYEYLKTAINITLDDPSVISAMTKVLYPKVAQLHSTSIPRAERAIRHAVETAFSNPGGSDLQDDIFGNSIGYDSGKPTNTHFIAAVADYIREISSNT